MKSDILSIFITTINAHTVQFTKLKKPYLNLSDLDFGFRGQLYNNFDYHAFYSFEEVAKTQNTLFHFQDNLDLEYLLFSLPTELAKANDFELCCIGPFLYSPISMQHFQGIADKLKLPIEYYKDLQEFYNQIPILTNITTWDTLFSHFLSLIFDFPLPYTEKALSLPCNRSITYDSNFNLNPSSTVSLSIIKERYEGENLLLHAVRDGNIQKALKYQNDFLRFQITPRASDHVRNSKNLGFSLNTLLRKAVEQANVHPFYIDKLSTQSAIQIENCTNLNQLKILFTSMIRKYCLLVNQYSRKQYSPIIQECLDYIDFHYEEPLSLDFLAKYSAVSNTYLSSLFKKEVGETVTNYINQTRIRQSLRLLNTTNLSIQAISETCGFNDANYFARTFKKIQGISAKTYRDTIHAKKNP